MLNPIYHTKPSLIFRLSNSCMYEAVTFPSTILYNVSTELPTKEEKDERTTPLGVYNGKQFLFRTGNYSILNKLKMFWRYGLTLLRVDLYVKSMVQRFVTIYDLQADGESFKTVPDMLRAMGGDDFVELTQVTSESFYPSRGWSKEFIDELVTAAVHDNYDQTLEVDAFTTLVSLVAMTGGDLWSVVGGNRQIPVKVLEAADATFHPEEVQSVTRVIHVSDGRVSYRVDCSGVEGEGEEFDVVIFANPLNVSRVRFNGFPNTIYGPAASTPYQRTVATLIKGEINPAFFGLSELGRDFPLTILTAQLEAPPFLYRTVAVNVPSELPTKEANAYLKPLCDDPVRTWKVFSPQPLMEEQKGQMFSRIEDEVAVDWMAYPVYAPPEEFPPFVLDNGVFYVNAIEKAASAMEMSAIGARNASLLAREYLRSRSGLERASMLSREYQLAEKDLFGDDT